MSANSNTNDLRTFIGQIEEMGQLRRLEGADWNIEIGAITECVSDKEGPALLFDSIKEYRKGWRILTNVFRTHERFALATGLPTGVPPLAQPEALVSGPHAEKLTVPVGLPAASLPVTTAWSWFPRTKFVVRRAGMETTPGAAMLTGVENEPVVPNVTVCASPPLTLIEALRVAEPSVKATTI